MARHCVGKFGPGDEVLVSVGDASWPAVIVKEMENPNKLQYWIFFTNTKDSAICDGEQLTPNVKNEVYESDLVSISLLSDKEEDSDAEDNITIINKTPQGEIKSNARKSTKSNLQESESPGAYVNPNVSNSSKNKIDLDTELTKKIILAELKVQLRLTRIDEGIKNSLRLNGADIESGLKYIDDLLKIELTPLMLKKHPEIVYTLKQLLCYGGNPGKCSMTKEETFIFATETAAIRKKTKLALDKIKTLFSVPDDESFWDVFDEKLKEFNDATKGWDLDDVFTSIIDPTKNTSSVDQSQKGKKQRNKRKRINPKKNPKLKSNDAKEFNI